MASRINLALAALRSGWPIPWYELCALCLYEHVSKWTYYLVRRVVQNQADDGEVHSEGG